VLRGCESTKRKYRHGCNADSYVAESHVDSSWGKRPKPILSGGQNGSHNGVGSARNQGCR
jgi:hypothetical protein